MSRQRRYLSLLLALWVAVLPAFLSGCTTQAINKRLLQHLNTEGFGKRYIGNAQEENYVTIGDGITFVDTYNPEIRGTARVDVDGTIELPEAGPVHVAGLTRSELETYLTQKLSPYFIETDVKVSITTGPSKVYYVLGEVRAKGPKPFPGDLTVFEAVLLAGPSEFTANLGRVKLIRPDPRDPWILPVNISEIWENGDSTYNVQVREFDIIYVPPTLMKQAADLVSGLIVPVTSVFRSILSFIFALESRGRFGGGRRLF